MPQLPRVTVNECFSFHVVSNRGIKLKISMTYSNERSLAIDSSFEWSHRLTIISKVFNYEADYNFFWYWLHFVLRILISITSSIPSVSIFQSTSRQIDPPFSEFRPIWTVVVSHAAQVSNLPVCSSLLYFVPTTRYILGTGSRTINQTEVNDSIICIIAAHRRRCHLVLGMAALCLFSANLWVFTTITNIWGHSQTTSGAELKCIFQKISSRRVISTTETLFWIRIPLLYM